MLNRRLTALFSLLLLPFLQGTAEAAIKWHDNYQEALVESKKDSKPLLLFFTGSDWCSWCHKLENEALDTQEFEDSAGNSFIFVKLDYPMSGTQEATIKEQNATLKQKYDIRGFPTVVILDANEKQAGVTGYRAGGGKQYAEHLKKIVGDYGNYNTKVRALDNTTS